MGHFTADSRTARLGSSEFCGVKSVVDSCPRSDGIGHGLSNGKSTANIYNDKLLF